MRVCIVRATGKLIGAQSGDDAEYGTLIANAAVAGYAEADVEERVVSQAEYEALEEANKPAPSVDELRRAAYGTVQDQLDMMYWDKVNGTDKWKDHVAKVKADNPK